MHRFLLQSGLASALLVLAGCTWQDGVPSEPPTTRPLISAGNGGAPPKDVVGLGMTVSDDPGFRIGSDGLGEYVNGVGGMQATVDAYGNLQISPSNATSSTPPTRRLDVRHADGLVYTYPNQWNFKIKSNRTNNANPRIQDMAVGAALCYNVTIGHRTQAIAFESDFNRAISAGATYALITRTGPASWTMTSGGVATTGLDCGVDDIAFLKGTDLTVKRGAFTIGLVNLPFSITLRSLP
jgi:hypothetical protein